MKRIAIFWIGCAVLGLGVLPATAQSPGGWYPIERPVYQSTTVLYGGQPAGYVPVPNEYPTISTRWDAPNPTTFAPGPVTSLGCAPMPGSPVVAGTVPTVNYPPAVTYVPVTSRYVAPTVAYMPVMARYPASPYRTYAPVAGGYPGAATAAGPKVWVHPKVYVEGQPLRNILRAITP